MELKRLPWGSRAAALAAAYFLKLCYSRASAGDLAWVLAPTARTVGWLRGEALAFDPGAGWVAPGGAYTIAPACAGVNFLILAFLVAVLGFAHRLRSPGRRLAWWLGALGGAYLLTLAVNTLRIVAAVELYRRGPVTGLTPEGAHRLLGVLVYLGALWGLYAALDATLSGRRTPAAAALLVPGLYLAMTVVVPLVQGASGSRYAEHAMMVSTITMLASAKVLLARAAKRRDGS